VAVSEVAGAVWPLDIIGRRPRLAAFAGAIFIAFSGILYRYAEVSPSTATFYRALFGLPLLLAVALAEHRRHGPMSPATMRLAAVAGIFFAGDLLFWHHSIEWIGAGLATVVANLQVLIVGLVAWLLLGERPSRRVLAALPIVLAGIVLISGVVGRGAYGADPTLGVALGILTALCYAGYLLLIRRGGRDLRRPAGPVAIATVSTAITALVAGSLLGDLDPTPAPQNLGWLVVMGITSQSVGYLIIAVSLPRLPAVVTSTILLFQPVAAVGLAFILLGETPSVVQLIGVGLVLGGIAVAAVPMSRRRITIPPGPT
jgi:drug/metabolite transporter (DMT)-like permease